MMRILPIFTAVLPVCLMAAETDWHRTALHSDKPDGEVLHLTIGGGTRPNILERWWNGRRVRWLDEAGTMQPGDQRGSLVNSTLQFDMNGDGRYDGGDDINLRWCDTDGDGVPDFQAIVLLPSHWDEKQQRYRNVGQWATMRNHDRRGVLWWMDWTKPNFHTACWDTTGTCNWLANYHGNNDFTKNCFAPHLMDDPRMSWENPFSFFDEDGDGVSEMSVRWATHLPWGKPRFTIPPELDRAHVSYDLDNNTGYGNETSYDLTLHGINAKVDFGAMKQPVPGFAGNPVFDPCFEHNEWRRITELLHMDRSKAYDQAFATKWKEWWLSVDEDGDDHRWERVETYYPYVKPGGKQVDIFSVSTPNKTGATGQDESDQPGPSWHPQCDSIGDRGEFDLDNSGGGKLYIGRFDRKLHLYGAEWGVWLADREAAFQGGWNAQSRESTKPRAKQVGEVVKYTDTDGDGFIDTFAFSYKGDRTFDLTVSLKDIAKEGEDLQKAEIIDPRALGWKGMHQLYLKLAAQAWDDAMMIYRAAWTRDLTTPDIDRLAAASSLRQRHMNAWWITEGIARGLAQRMTALAAEHPERAEAARKCHRDFIAALYAGRTADAVRVLATTPN
jgi:hypothetical protein